MGKTTLSIAIFHSFLYVHQAGIFPPFIAIKLTPPLLAPKGANTEGLLFRRWFQQQSPVGFHHQDVTLQSWKHHSKKDIPSILDKAWIIVLISDTKTKEILSYQFSLAYTLWQSSIAIENDHL